MQQLVLEVRALVLGKLTVAPGVLDPLELGTNPGGVVVLLLCLVPDVLGHPQNAPDRGERQPDQTDQQPHRRSPLGDEVVGGQRTAQPQPYPARELATQVLDGVLELLDMGRGRRGTPH